MTARKILLVELNEITWRLIDPLLKRNELPALADLIRRGVRGTPLAPEVPPDLDPWISWTTVFTGRPPHEHGVKFLEQPPDTVQGPKIWDLVAKAGKSLGVFGSTMSWPPRTDVKGFVVPGTFSPGTETHPADLKPIQDLNITYTRAHTPVGGEKLKKPGKLSLFLGLRRLGLKLSTVFRVLNFLVKKKLKLAPEWQAVSLQPVINADLFAHLWRQHRPDFATFHTNHVAHYQHRYWRSFDPTPFLEKPPAEEVNKFGGCIPFGYRVADEVLGRLTGLVDENTVLIVASGLGQQPYVVEEFREGRSVLRLQDITRTLELIGVAGKCRPYSVMAPQWNIEFDSLDAQKLAVDGFNRAYYGTPDRELFACTEMGNTLCVNIRQKLPRPLDWDAPCVFPTTGRQVPLRELVAEKDATPKQGYHEQAGVLVMAGPGIKAGATVNQCSTLDLAPTMLALMGLPIPAYMTGRVLSEVLDSSVVPTRLDVDMPSGRAKVTV